jgi:hypothetical protein
MIGVVECRRSSVGHMAYECDDPFAQVISEVQEIGRPRSLRQQVCHERLIRLGCVAPLASEDQVIAPVVGRLAATGRYVVQRNGSL